MQSLNYYTNPM